MTNHTHNPHGDHRVAALPKDKYIGLIEKHYLRILVVYPALQEKKPVILFDVTEGKIYAYPHKAFKKELNECAQMSLADQDDEALQGDRFVIFLRDSKNRRLVSYLLEQSQGYENNCELVELERTAAREGGGNTRQIYRTRRPGGGRKSIQRSLQHWNRCSKKRSPVPVNQQRPIR
jgi:hypothetical protein